MAENQRPDGLFSGERHYDGRGLGAIGPWKCPACAAENVGPLEGGCTSCGSGSARPFKVVEQPPDLHLAPKIHAFAQQVLRDIEECEYDRRQAVLAAQADTQQGTDAPTSAQATPLPDPSDLDRVARDWCRVHADAATEDAFVAGCYYMHNLLTARTLAAPPVTADVEQLAPEGKVRRTIIAALEIFKDQVLRDADAEIASGEWCSIPEIEELLSQLRQEEGL